MLDSKLGNIFNECYPPDWGVNIENERGEFECQKNPLSRSRSSSLSSNFLNGAPL